MNTNKTVNIQVINQMIEVVDASIVSKKAAKQLVLEEIETASHGNEMARYFAYDSGFSSDEYRGSIDKSLEQADNIKEPQQLLLKAVFLINTHFGSDASVSFRIKLVKSIMEHYKLGKYGSQEGNYESH